MTPEDIVAVDADEAFDIEYELRGRHNPIEHAGEPCGGGCCTCTRDGCDAMWALSLLTRERKMLAAAQERIAALEAALWDYANPDNWQTTDLYEFPDLWIVRGENGCDRARAALAGSQGGGGETRQDVACTETVHRVQEGADACDCGENRMELML